MKGKEMSLRTLYLRYIWYGHVASKIVILSKYSQFSFTTGLEQGANLKKNHNPTCNIFLRNKISMF